MWCIARVTCLVIRKDLNFILIYKLSLMTVLTLHVSFFKYFFLQICVEYCIDVVAERLNKFNSIYIY